MCPSGSAAVVIFRDVVIIGGAVTYNYLIKPVPGEPNADQQTQYSAAELLFLLFVLSQAAICLARSDHADGARRCGFRDRRYQRRRLRDSMVNTRLEGRVR